MSKSVAVVGATDKPGRYAYQALLDLKAHGFSPVPVNPKRDEVAGMKCYASVADAGVEIDTVTLYVRPDISSGMTDDIISARPRRVIMNPGAENVELARACENAGIEVIRACTLVMLRTGSF